MEGRRADRIAGGTLLFLGLAFGLFFVLPFVGLVSRGFAESGTWALMWSDTARSALVLSLWTATVTAGITVVFGTPVAYFLARRRFPGSSVIDALIDLPIILPPTATGVALLTAFGRRGLLGEPLEAWTGLSLSFTTVAVVMAQLLVSAPFYLRAAKSGFERLDVQQERVAYTLGATRLTTFVRISLPQAWPALIAGVVLCWSRAVGELGATLIFAGNLQGKTQTMPLAIISAFEGTTLGLPGAVAFSLILLAVAVVVLSVFRAAAGRAVGRL
jgi:molybdate transport system permease protein